MEIFNDVCEENYWTTQMVIWNYCGGATSWPIQKRLHAYAFQNKQ